MKLSDSVALVGKLLDAFPNAKIGDGSPQALQRTTQVYAEALADLDADAARRAIVELISTSKFFPSIAEIRGVVAEREANLPSADEAWAGVIAAVRSGSPTREPGWDNPCTAMAVRSVGWWTMCNSSKISFERAQFIATYNRAREIQVRGLNSDRLLASAERDGLLGMPKPGARVGGVASISQLTGNIKPGKDSE